MPNTQTRKYRMTRIGPGDYLLPSNDARTLWHIYRYEDGQSHGLEGVPDRDWWACAYYRGTYEQAVRAVERNIEDYGYIERDDWTERACYLRTRAEAVAEALRA